MQLLTMAMQTEQEDDNNGNQASDIGIPRNHDNNSSDANPQHHHCFQRPSPVTKLSSDVLLHGSRHEQLQTEEAGSPTLESTSMAPGQQVIQFNRPGQLFRGTDSSVSADECGDSFCHTASLSVDSDSSSSPDINSNTLIVGFGQADLSGGGVDKHTVSWTSSTSLSDQKMYKNMTAHDNESPLIVEEGDGEGTVLTQSVTIPGEDQTEHQVNVVSASHLIRLHDDSGRRESCRHPESRSLEKETVPLPGLGSGEIYSSGHRSQQEASGLFHSLPDTVFRHSVDMDVDSADTEEHVLVAATEGIHSRFLAPQAGPAGENRPFSLSSLSLDAFSSHSRSLDSLVSHNQLTASAAPTSVITESLAAETSLNYRDSLNVNVQVTSPQEISLPVVPLSSETGSVSLTEERLAQSPWSSDVQRKITRFSFFDSSPWTCGSPPNLSQSGDDHHDVSRVMPQRSRRNERSSERSERSLEEVQWAELRNSDDLGQEEWLEEELWLYACGLLSCAPEPPTSGDRQELHDPVASLLTEGDNMHFIPIREECTFNHPAGTHTSSHSPG